MSALQLAPHQQDPGVAPWIRKYLAALLADPALQPTVNGLIPQWLEQQIDPAIDRGQSALSRMPIQHVVTRTPAMVLLGPAGSGKSLMLRSLIHSLAQEALANPQAPLPLYVPLTFFTGSIENTLAAQARGRGPSLATLALARPCILIVDALNDLPPAEQIAILNTLRRALSILGPHGRWIIACRSEAWGMFDIWFSGSRYQVWRIRPWSDQDIHATVQRLGTPAAQRLLRLPGVVELARRPRWLGAMLQISDDLQPGPFLIRWIEATAEEAARTHCLSDRSVENAVPLLRDLGAMLQRHAPLGEAAIEGIIADAARAGDMPTADLQALADAMALLHANGDDDLALRSQILHDLAWALDLRETIEEQTSFEVPAPALHSTALALLYSMLPSPQRLIGALLSAKAWEAVQRVLDANVNSDDALTLLEETNKIDTTTAAALGRAWANKGTPEVAIALLDWTVRQGRDDPYLFGLLGHLYRKAGHWNEARSAFQDALRRDPTNLDYQQALAQVCQALGESDTATTTLESLLASQHGRLAAAAFQLGSLHEEQGRPEEALQQYTLAATLCPAGVPEYARYHVAKARLLRLTNRPEEAITALRAAGDDPDIAAALADEYAALLEANGEDQQALERLGQIEALGSATATTYLRMADLHSRRDEVEAADRAYRAAIEVDPRCVEAYEGLAEMAARHDDIHTAVSAYERLIDLTPGDAVAWRRLGAFQRQAERYAESNRSLQTSLRIETSPEAQLELARTRWAQGDQVNALSLYRTVAANDHDGRMAAEAGWALLEAGDLVAAQSMLENAAALRPADGRVLYDLGRCYEAQGAVTRALEWYMQAAHVTPTATTLRAAGRTARLLGERSIARQMFARALQADRHYGDTLAEIGRLHLEEGRADLAARAFKRARSAGLEGIELQRDEAEALLQLGNARAALQILETVSSDDNDFQTKRSRAYELLGDPHGALLIARNAAARQPRNAALQRRVGSLALQSGLAGEALVALETARSLGDKEQQTLIDLSRAMLLTGRINSAAKAIDEALQRIAHGSPDEPQVHLQHGHVLLALEEWSEAQQAFQRVLALTGKVTPGAEARPAQVLPSVGKELVAEAWAGLAKAYAHIAGPAAAAPYARHAMELMPQAEEHARLVAHLLLEQGDYSSARQVLKPFTNAGSKTPAHLNSATLPNGSATSELATCRLRLEIEMADQHWQDAVILARQCHSLAPQDASITATYGTALLYAGHPGEALPLLEAVCSAASAAPEWWAALGQCQLRQGNTAAAIQSLNHSLEGRPDIATTHADLAMAHLAQGAPGAAAHAFRQALELGGERLEWRTALARAYTTQGWYAEALVEWERARKLAPQDADLRLEIAQAQIEMGNPEPALADLENLVSTHPKHAAAWQLLSRAALEAGNPARAVYAAACALGERPQDPKLRVLLAEAALANGDARRAYDAVAPLVEAETPDIHALLLVHQAANQLKEPSAARAALEQAGRLAPGDPDVQLAIAEHLQALGEGTKALKLLHSLFNRHNDSASVAAALARQAFKAGALGLARQAAERAAVLSPQDASYARLLGEICFDEGDHTMARKALNQAMRSRQDPTTALLLGKLALERGEITEAQRLLRLAHEHRSDDPEMAGWLALSLRRQYEPVVEDEAPTQQPAPALDAAIQLLQKFEAIATWRGELG